MNERSSRFVSELVTVRHVFSVLCEADVMCLVPEEKELSLRGTEP